MFTDNPNPNPNPHSEQAISPPLEPTAMSSPAPEPATPAAASVQPTPIQPVLINTMQQTISRFVSKVASSNEEPKAQQNEGPTAQQSTVTVPRKDLDQFISSQKTFISRVARMLKLDASQLREQLQSKIIHLDIMTTERQQYATQYNEMKLKYKVISMLITSD